MIQNQLIIFVKAPRPGFVKTRLAASLGPEAAAQAYYVLVDKLLVDLTTTPRSLGSRGNEALTSQSAIRNPQSVIRGAPHSIEIRFTPDDAFAEIQQWLRPNWSARSQGPGDLGERMQRAFFQAFASGAERVALIGSDCPTIAPEDVQCAWTALARHDLVLGPATDGGYWLIGLTSAQPELFEGIAWSTNTVLPETLRRATALGLRVHMLSQRTDVDTDKDWQEFLRAHVAGCHSRG